MPDPTRVLLVGTGRMGQSHLQSLKNQSDLAEVIAAVDPSEAARHTIRDDFGVERSYDNLEEALEKEEATAAIISVPNFLHAEYALACMEKGLHILIEKPMALNIGDVDRMVQTADSKGLLLMSGQSLRFVPSMRYVKQLLHEGTVGRIRHVTHRRLGAGRGGDFNSWFSRQDRSGGILPGIGSHSLDVLLWWLAERATSVYAVVHNIDPHPDIDIEDEVSLVATMESGAILNAALSFHHKAGTEWIVMGEEGVIHLHGMGEKLTVNGEERPIPEETPLPGESEIHREFLTAIREGRPLAQAAGSEIRHTMALIFAAMESGREGKAVVVP
jgi:predicted dehydrogenase